jgi:hypothetical protein
VATKKLPPEVRKFFQDEGRRGGLKSGEARMEKLTPEKRSEVAKIAAAASAAVRKKKARKATKKR